ncbi:hypothetical protein DHW03_06560 [Pedobacter yonginense]|uniref:DUF4926 domain-containing protein n=1 Tax=Pedobacter yonginense TaxID=651869 RepID=A0A317ERD5_9SPHI|nr:hypothetical protein [Pedobacter yonginense]PWS29470.1 hypothetical protein DHW03_06560 [Pedobacter yonginense]
MIIKHSSSIKELESIKIGDKVKDEYGKEGFVEEIEILKYRESNQYYFKLKNRGTILVLK